MCVHACVRACVCVHVRACVTCVCVCVCVCVCALATKLTINFSRAILVHLAKIDMLQQIIGLDWRV